MAIRGGKSYTIANIEALPEGARAELIDGEMFRMDVPTLTHQDLLIQIAIEIGLYIRKKRGKLQSTSRALCGIYQKRQVQLCGTRRFRNL